VRDLPQHLQQTAFDRLVGSLSENESPKPVSGHAVDGSTSVEADPDINGAARRHSNRRSPPKAVKTSRTRRRSTRRSWSPDNAIDFEPEGKTAFVDFAIDKGPSGIPQKVLIAVHYMEIVLGLSGIGPSQILAAFRVADWNEPVRLGNSMAIARSNGWVSYSSTPISHLRLRVLTINACCGAFTASAWWSTRRELVRSLSPP